MTPKQEAILQKLLTDAHHDFEKGLKARAFFKLNDHIVSGDLVQNTFMKTWIYLVRVGKIDMMKAFLYHVLNDLIIDEYRKHKTTSLDVLMENGFDPSVYDSNHLFNNLDGKSALLLIDRLPKKYQKIMRMKYIQDLSLEEMALETGQTRNSVAVQAYRGLEKLKILHKNNR